MGLLDLKSDLTKAFKKQPIGGKLEKRLDSPQTTKYSAKPKKYQIPNNGKGIGIKYDNTSGDFKANSRYSNIQNTSEISGRHSSNIEPVISTTSGRHDNVDIKLDKLAQTPAKTAVEPIAMSATPVKLGVTPTLMPNTAVKVGTTPTKIPISGYTTNRYPEMNNKLYSLDVGEGALAEMGGISKFNIDKLPKSYFITGNFESDYFKITNNENYGTESKFDPENTKPYAPSGYTIDRLSRYFTPIRDAINLDMEIGTTKSANMQMTGEVDSFNPSIQIHGSNVLTPYDLDLESVLSADNFYEDTNGLRFFTDANKVIENPAGVLETNLPSPTMIHPPGWTGMPSYQMQFGDITNFFSDHEKTIAGFLNHDPQGDQYGNGTMNIGLSDQLVGGINFFDAMGDNEAVTQPTISNAFQVLARNVGGLKLGFIPRTNPNVGITVRPVPLETDYNFLNMVSLTNEKMTVKGKIDLINNTFRLFEDTQNFFNQDNPIMSNGFAPQFNGKQLVLTGPSWNWSLGNTELTEFEWILNGLDNPSMLSIDQDPNNGAVNYFSGKAYNGETIQNIFHNGFEKEPSLALVGDSHTWSHSATVVSRYVGIDNNLYINPSTYWQEDNSTNYFDTSQRYTQQFARNKSAYNGGNENSDYVNVINGEYNSLDISSTNSDYSFNSLFNNQLAYWMGIDLYSGLNRFDPNEDGIKSLGDVNSSPGDFYRPGGLHPNPTADIASASEYVDETSGTFKHKMDDTNQWSYYAMIGNTNSNWGSGISSFSAQGGGTPSYSTPYRYLSNGMSSWIVTAEELGSDEFESIEENLQYNHPGYRPEDDISTYGYGLGRAGLLQWWDNGVTAGSGKKAKTIYFRNPMGKKHISWLDADQMIVNKDDDWSNKHDYFYGPKMYGTKAGLSSGGLGGISFNGRGGTGGNLILNPYDADNQIFTSIGAGISSMGGITYEDRMMDIYIQNTTQRSVVGSVLNNLNPIDNMAAIKDQMKSAFDDTIKRWWAQHNRFAIQLSNNPPKGTHQGLPGDSATGAVGRFAGMANQLSPNGGDMLSTITGLSARKYWSVLHYPAIQMAAEVIDTGMIRFNDFRMFISDMGAIHVGLSGAANYIENNMHKRYGLPEPGKPGLDRKMYYKHIPGTGDDITMEDFYTGEQLADEAKKDFINFQMKDVVNDQAWRFRAYITGLTDSIQPNWGQYNYIGRPDPVFQYNGASARTISFNLKVAALAAQDLYWMWKKINKLLGMCYPAGYDKGQFMTGPMMEMTIGDYIVQAPGFLNALTISIPDSSPWEINQQDGSGGPFSSLGNSIATVTNVLNDPLGAASGFIPTKQEDPYPAARKNNKSYMVNEFDAENPDTKGDLLAQMPHIADLSIGYTVIGHQDKSSMSTHFGPALASNPSKREFFQGWSSDTTNSPDTPGTAGQVMDFLGL